MWHQFLMHPSVFSRPFTDFATAQDATILDLYRDSSRNFNLGCGGVFNNKWFFIGWDEFTKYVKPSIEYLKLFAVAVAVKLWARLLKNQRVVLFCDNQVAMMNSSSSTCKNCMVLVRFIVLESLINNVKISARFVCSQDNCRADALSRRKFKLFKSLSPQASEQPEEIPTQLWPLAKIWQF